MFESLSDVARQIAMWSIVVNLFLMLASLMVLGLVLKIYTELLKDKSMDKRSGLSGLNMPMPPLGASGTKNPYPPDPRGMVGMNNQQGPTP